MLSCKYTGAGLDIDIVNVSMRTGFNKSISTPPNTQLLLEGTPPKTNPSVADKVMVDIHEETQWAMAQELPEATKGAPMFHPNFRNLNKPPPNMIPPRST